MKRRIFHFFVVALLASTLSCHCSNESRTSKELETLSNADVSWDGTFFGLQPSLSGPATEVLNQGEAVIRQALDDPKRIVVAHVLLTKICGSKYDVSGGSWNGLKVRLLASGAVQYDEANLREVRNRWSRSLTSSNP